MHFLEQRLPQEFPVDSAEAAVLAAGAAVARRSI